MNTPRLLLLILLTVCMQTSSLSDAANDSGSEKFRMIPVEAAEVETEGTITEATDPENLDWQGLDPIWSGSKNEIEATLKAAFSREGLHFSCEIKDPTQSNEYAERNLWRGDCIYLSLDALGEKREIQPADAEGELPGDDATFLLALGAEGPDLRVTDHGVAALQSTHHADWIETLERDDAAQTTLYRWTVPWHAISADYGLGHALGLALTVAHKNEPEDGDLTWGNIRAGKGKQRELHYFEYARPAEDFASSAGLKTHVLPGQTAEIWVGARTAQPAEIVASLGDHAVKVEVKPGEEAVVRRLRIIGDLITADDHVVQVRIDPLEGQEPLLREDFVLLSVESAFGMLKERVKLLLEGVDAGEPGAELARTHLQSTLALLESARARLPFQPVDYTQRFIEAADYMLGKLPKEEFNLEFHRKTGVPLVVAFSSEADQSLQFYGLQLPFDWDFASTEKPYPLTVYLHGMGSENPVDGLLLNFDNSGQDTLFTWEESDPQNVPPAHRGFIVAPWGRANSFYRGFGEVDVWQSIADAEERFPIDPDRRYLSGFSMGGIGGWRLVASRPDVFAAVNLASGFWQSGLADHRVENVQNLPFYLHYGELETSWHAHAEAFRKAFEDAGIQLDIREIPAMPHTYPHPLFQEQVGRMMEHTRKRPNDFSYTAETGLHPSAWGIMMNYQRLEDRFDLPRFDAKISEDNQTLELQSEGVEAFQIDLGPEGLNMTAPVTVIWNGQEEYSGPIEPIFLGPEFQRW